MSGAGRKGCDAGPPPEGGEAELLRQLEIASRAVFAICRRHGLSPDEGAELESFVRVRLLDNDRRILAKFQGRSSLATYLTTVVQRLFLDFRDARWGKWRASRAAVRLGPAAVLLERLLLRDGLSFDDAAAAIAKQGIRATRPELAQLRERLPRREISRTALPVPPEGQDPAAGNPEEALRRREEAGRARQVAATLCGLLRELSPEDRLTLKLRFQDGASVASIAGLLQKNPKQLHRQIARLLARLRDGLAAAGIEGDDVPGLFDLVESDLALFDAEPAGENLLLRPSNSLRGGSE